MVKRSKRTDLILSMFMLKDITIMGSPSVPYSMYNAGHPVWYRFLGIDNGVLNKGCGDGFMEVFKG